MQLMSYLADKPKSYRDKMAFSAAAVLTSFVFIVWFSTLDARLGRNGGELTADNRESGVAAVPFATDEISKQFDTIQGTLNLLRGADTTAPALEAETFEAEGQTPLPETDEPFY